MDIGGKQIPLKPIKVLIGIPSRGDFKADMALSLVFMIHNLTSNPIVKIGNSPRYISWHIQRLSSSMLYSLRQKMVDTALDADVDYLLFLDDDMVFPGELLHAWLAADRAVIAANCPTRGVPTNPTARSASARNPKGEMVYSDIAHLRWEKVWRVGTGICLLRRDALKALPRPAFQPHWVEELEDFCGEDWAMMEHLERAGIPIYIDNEISLGVGHIGEMTFTHEMVAGSRKAENQLVTINPPLIVPDRVKEL
jgi:glycosyltransferase involved in cell wall biosynthesis